VRQATTTCQCTAKPESIRTQTTTRICRPPRIFWPLEATANRAAAAETPIAAALRVAVTAILLGRTNAAVAATTVELARPRHHHRPTTHPHQLAHHRHHHQQQQQQSLLMARWYLMTRSTSLAYQLPSPRMSWCRTSRLLASSRYCLLSGYLEANNGWCLTCDWICTFLCRSTRSDELPRFGSTPIRPLDFPKAMRQSRMMMRLRPSMPSRSLIVCASTSWPQVMRCLS
jgi:hypothetical protein